MNGLYTVYLNGPHPQYIHANTNKNSCEEKLNGRSAVTS